MGAVSRSVHTPLLPMQPSAAPALASDLSYTLVYSSRSGGKDCRLSEYEVV